MLFTCPNWINIHFFIINNLQETCHIHKSAGSILILIHLNIMELSLNNTNFTTPCNYRHNNINLPRSIFGVNGATCSRVGVVSGCRLGSLGVDSFSARMGFAAAIVYFRISSILCALLWIVCVPSGNSDMEPSQSLWTLLFSSCWNN